MPLDNTSAPVEAEKSKLPNQDFIAGQKTLMVPLVLASGIALVSIALLTYVLLSPASVPTPVLPVVSPETPSDPTVDGNAAEVVVPEETLPGTGIVTSNVANITFALPPGWQEVTGVSTSTTLPDTLSEPQIVLINQAQGCTIALGTPAEGRRGYAQASFGKRIFDKNNQHDGNWFARPTSTAIVFSHHDRQFIVGEYLTYYSSSYDGHFVLWAGPERSVPSQCVSDFEQLLATIDYYFPPLTQGAGVSGVLTIKTTSRGGGVRSSLLALTDPATQETWAYLHLPPESRWYGRWFVDGEAGRLYGFSPRSLLIVDTASQAFTEEPVVWPTPVTVLSHFVHQNKIYAVVVPTAEASCADGYKGCTTDVIAFDLATKQFALVASGLRGMQIIGFDKESAAMYMRSGWGDAGCMAHRIDMVHAGSISSLLDVSYCYGDDTHNEGSEPKEAETARIIAEYVNDRIGFSPTSTRALWLEKSSLQPYTDSATNAGPEFVFLP